MQQTLPEEVDQVARCIVTRTVTWIDPIIVAAILES